VAQKSARRQFVVRCECGFEARGTLTELYPVIQKHGRESHNMKVTRAGLTAMARPA
jgi:predicted small metal-binding protein